MAKARGLSEQLKALARAAQNVDDAPEDAPENAPHALWDLVGVNLPMRAAVERFFAEPTHRKRSQAAPDALEFIGRAMGQALIRRLADNAIHHCDSPLEEEFLYALIIQGWLNDFAVQVGAARTGYGALSLDVSHEHDELTIVAQPEIGKLHPDFLIKTKTFHHMAPSDEEPSWATSRLAIECDGHDFHEKTKEQVRRDKRRDREIAAAGVPLVRFAGSEIHEDPLGKAEWAIRHAIHLAWRPIIERELLSGPAAYGITLQIAMGRGSVPRESRENDLIKQTGWTLAEWRERLGIKEG